MPDEEFAMGLPMAPEEKKRGLFAKPAPVPQADTGAFNEQLNSLSSRVRLSEERYGELRRKLVVIEQNILGHQKKSATEIKTINAEISELKHMISEVEDRILTIIKELKLTAKREDIDVMKKYVELWNPVKFVSVDHVEKIVEEALRRRQSDSEKSL